MFDGGNSRGHNRRRERYDNYEESVCSSISAPYVVRSPYRPSTRKCIENEILCGLIDDIRYSGRFRPMYNVPYEQCKPKEYISRKKRHSRHERSNIPAFIIDGGKSSTDYTSSPKIDLGTASANPLEICNTFNNYRNNRCSGVKNKCKMVLDGGNAREVIC